MLQSSITMQKKCSASHQITNELHEVKERKKVFFMLEGRLKQEMKSENFECSKKQIVITHSNVVLDRVLIVISLDRE